MPLTAAQLKAAYIALGCDEVWPLRANLNGSLDLYANTSAAGAGIAYTDPGPESARSGNVATFSGGGTSYANLGTLAGVGSRVQAGGGLTLSIHFKIPNTVTAWRIGNANPTSGNYLYYDCNASNNQIIYGRSPNTANYLDTSTAMATALRDNTWHCLALTYNHVTGVLRTFIDGEPWNDARTIDAWTTENDGLTPNVDNWIIGGYSFNGSTSASSTFASAFAELAVASKCMSDEEIRKLYELGVATYWPASHLPLRVGPRADQVASRVSSDLKYRKPIIVIPGDSRMTQNGQGQTSVPALHRGLNAVSGNRVSNYEWRLSDTVDANSPPGHSLSIAGGATQKYLFGLRTNDIFNNDNLIGSDNTVRRSLSFDGSAGLSMTIAMRKESGGRGPITYILRGSDILPGANPMDGTEGYQKVIASGTLFSQAELTGTSLEKAYKTIAGPATGRYRFYQVELTNTGGSAVNLEDIDLLSNAKADGPCIKFMAAGGYKVSDYYEDHANWPALIRAYRVFKGTPPIHFIAILGPNDGANMTPTEWYAAFASFCASLFSDFPDATLTMCLGAAVDGVGLGARTNYRVSNMVGAVKEFAEANPSLAISGCSVGQYLEKQYGWSGWTQSTTKYNVVGEYAAATAYTQGQVVWTRTNSTASLKRYWYHRNNQTGAQLLQVEKATEVVRYLSDGLHHTEAGAIAFVEADVYLATFEGTLTDVITSGGSALSTGTVMLSTGSGLAA